MNHKMKTPIFDVHNHVGVDVGSYVAGDFPYGQSYFDLVEAAERNDVSHIVVFPMVAYLAQSSFQGDMLLSGQKIPYAWENRRLCEEIFQLFSERSKSTYVFAMFDPGREVPAQIQELRALKKEFPIHGLKTQATIIKSPISALHKQGKAFLELALEWDVPLLIHSSVLPADIWSQAHDIIDIAEQWPEVRFNIAHSCRFDKECLDRIAQLPNCWFDVSAHGIHCDLAVEDNPIVAPVERRFQSDYSQPAVVLGDLARSYTGKVLWGSDSPYHSYCARVEDQTLELMSSFERETGFLKALPDDLIAEIAYSNVVKWLGITDV
jgi:predicted TIM-barrel fold metal-dependent hydrolase